MKRAEAGRFEVYRLARGYVVAPSLRLLPPTMRQALQDAPVHASAAVDVLHAPRLWKRLLDELEANCYAVLSADEFVQMFAVPASGRSADAARIDRGST